MLFPSISSSFNSWGLQEKCDFKDTSALCGALMRERWTERSKRVWLYDRLLFEQSLDWMTSPSYLSCPMNIQTLHKTAT